MFAIHFSRVLLSISTFAKWPFSFIYFDWNFLYSVHFPIRATCLSLIFHDCITEYSLVVVTNHEAIFNLIFSSCLRFCLLGGRIPSALLVMNSVSRPPPPPPLLKVIRLIDYRMLPQSFLVTSNDLVIQSVQYSLVHGYGCRLWSVECLFRHLYK